MKCEWSKLPLGKIADFIDYRGKTPPKTTSGIPLITAKIIKDNVIQTPTEFISTDYYDKWMTRGIPQCGNVVFTTEAPMGEVARIKIKEKLDFAQRIIILQGKKDILDDGFLFYALQYEPNKKRIEARSSGTTVFGIKSSELKKVIIDLPCIDIQVKIANMLSVLDEKIANNAAINHHLEQMAQAIFKSWFVDFEPFGGVMPTTWISGEAEDFFDISIGKTPPRKEFQWFTTNPQDVTWVSITDMGSCGVFISGSSECLTAESVVKFNIKVVPSGTVLLSFKLTVGRIAITNGEMTTNEAIAHFKRSEDTATEYLYYYLKAFDYQSLGNTSSIATAVNSKTIKAMPFVMPDEKTLKSFHAAVSPLFEQIKVHLEESVRLAALRDSLLPRLISGELSIANVDVK